MSPVLRSARRLLDGLFAGDPVALPNPRRSLVLAGRTVALALRDWIGDQCALRAAALTYMTFMAIVPLLALATAVARGLEADEPLWAWVQEWSRTTTPEIQEAVGAIQAFVEKTNFLKLGAPALVLLVWTAFSVFTRVDRAFQAIWKARSRAGGVGRFGTYFAVLLLAPPLAVAAFTSNYAATGARLLEGLRVRSGPLAPLLEGASSLVPLAVQSGVFVLLYRAIPKSRVRWLHALAGGLAAGLLWQGVQHLYFLAQIGLANYNAIYGSFAALPLLLAFVYASWSVLLFGGEIAHSAGQAGGLRRWRGFARLRPATRPALLAVMSAASEAYRRGEGPWRPPGAIPLDRDSIDAAVENLVAAGILARTESPAGGLVPARPPGQVTVLEVVRAGEKRDPEDGLLPAALSETCARADSAAAAVLGGKTFGPPGAEPAASAPASPDEG